MKEIKDKSLEFVLRYYQAGKLDTKQAIRKVMPAKAVSLWHKWAVAASLTGAIIGGAYAAFTTLNDTASSEKTQYQEPQASKKTSRHFHFDDTPLSEVLQELGSYYGLTLTADKTDKRLTADFDSDNLDETIRMIEQVLSVKIEKTKKKGDRQ